MDWDITSPRTCKQPKTVEHRLVRNNEAQDRKAKRTHRPPSRTHEGPQHHRRGEADGPDDPDDCPRLTFLGKLNRVLSGLLLLTLIPGTAFADPGIGTVPR